MFIFTNKRACHTVIKELSPYFGSVVHNDISSHVGEMYFNLLNNLPNEENKDEKNRKRVSD